MPKMYGFEILEEIKRTEKSFVFKGQKANDTKTYLVKVFNISNFSKIELAKFRNEFEKIKNLNIKNIPQYVEILTTSQEIAIVREYFNGENISEYFELLECQNQLLINNSKDDEYRSKGNMGMNDFMNAYYAKILEQKNNTMKMILDNSKEGFLFFGNNFIINNDYSLECTKIFSGQILNKSFANLLYPDNENDRLNLENLLKKIFSTAKEEEFGILFDMLPHEHLLGKKVIRIDYKPVNFSDLSNFDERIIMAIINDESEKIKLDNQIVYFEKMVALGNMVAGIAHEINTPIGVTVTAISHIESKINKFMKIFNENNIRKSDLESFLRSINETIFITSSNIKKASNILSSFKRVAIDMTNEEEQTFMLKEYLENILMTLSPVLKNTKILVSIECDESIEIKSYPGAISQIITNLLMNSLLHAFDKEQEGNIHINVTKAEEFLMLEFADNGKGIPQDKINRIFDTFFTSKRGEGGSGLGLSIVKNLVNKTFGGIITCESKIYYGTKFTIKFPLHICTDFDGKIHSKG